jgi:hypothetical protein
VAQDGTKVHSSLRAFRTKIGFRCRKFMNLVGNRGVALFAILTQSHQLASLSDEVGNQLARTTSPRWSHAEFLIAGRPDC